MLVFPELLAGLGVKGVDARVGGRDIHHAVIDQRLRLLAALLLAAKRHRPDRCQALDAVGVDVAERRIALALGTQAPAEHVVGGGGVLGDHLVVDLGTGLGGGGQHQ